jgi:hypothetical protein
MRMRPTIGICYNGKIIDSNLYYNMGVGNLLTQAFRLYEKYKDCKTPQMYMKRKIAECKKKNPNYVYDKKCWEEFVEMDMLASEFNLNIDFANHCIYYGRRIKSREELLKYPDSRTMMPTLTRRQQTGFKTDYFMTFIEKSVFWLEELNVSEILRLSAHSAGFRKYYWR